MGRRPAGRFPGRYRPAPGAADHCAYRRAFSDPHFFSSMNRVFYLLPLGLAALAFSSCASISVQPNTETGTSRMPARIYVSGFDATHGEFRVDREKTELTGFQENLQFMMQTAMIVDINKRLGIPTQESYPEQEFHPENAWMIRGEFTRVNQGSRLLRSTIGFGAGGTKVETNVYVYDLNVSETKPFLTFSTTGGSNAEPGAISGLATDPIEIAVQAALSGVGGVAHGLTEDTKRTAREITAVLSDYMYRHGWIDKEKWIKPKALEH